MAKFTCLICNKEFEATRKSAICPECKATPAICVICGKEFERKHPYTQKTCSSKCRGEYRKESGVAKLVSEKMKQTKLERYGTLDPAEVAKKKKGSDLDPKACKWCGKMFVPDSPRQIYCKETHYGACPVCGNRVEIKDLNIGPQACSEKCRLERISSTCEQKYGAKYAVISDHAKELAKQTNLKKYGEDHYSKTDEYKERFKQTSLERYGTEFPMQSHEIKERAKEGNKSKYGVESHMQTPEGKAKVKAALEDKYGGVGLASQEIRNKAVATNKERYGVEFPVSNPEIRQKGINTIRKRYKVDNYLSSKENMEDRMIDPSKIDEYLAFKANPVEYINSHYSSKPPIYILTRDLGVSDTPIYDILIKHDCKDAIDRTKMSTMEYEMLNYLKQIVPNAQIRINDRTVIKPKELDFYLPEYKFAIECNPTITHNSTTNSWSDSNSVMPYNYHKLKSQEAEAADIFLMHIFGYEWVHKQDIMKSMIANVLKCNASKIYARNTTVREISARDAREFLNKNHRQGACNSPIRLGLVDKVSNELVSLMTFGATRPGIGKQDTDTANTFELIRFCNKINTSVVGGASKLFKYFIKHYEPETVVSFSDIAHTKGNLYKQLGFQEISRSDPGYCWVKPYGEIYRSRVSCQKHLLPSIFDDVTEEDIKNKSERVIMIEHGYLQVFDSGVIRWEYYKSLK